MIIDIKVIKDGKIIDKRYKLSWNEKFKYGTRIFPSIYGRR